MNYQKSSVTAWNATNQTLLQNGTVTLANSKNTGCSIRFVAGGSSFNLLKPGLYYIDVSASGVESGTAGTISLQLFLNGNPVSGALSSANSSAVTDIESLSFSKLIEIKPTCPMNCDTNTLTIVNTGVGATYSNINVNLFKLA